MPLPRPCVVAVGAVAVGGLVRVEASDDFGCLATVQVLQFDAVGGLDLTAHSGWVQALCLDSVLDTFQLCVRQPFPWRQRTRRKRMGTILAMVPVGGRWVGDDAAVVLLGGIQLATDSQQPACTLQGISLGHLDVVGKREDGLVVLATGDGCAASIMEAAACAKPATGYTYARREPEKTALFQVLQQHLLTFEQRWTDEASGHTLPKFVTDELHDFLGCGILARGLAQLFCPTCHERYVVGWSCKGRGFCPSCGGRRMNAGALTLVDHVLPEVPIRQFVLTMPFPLRFPLAFDGKLLGQVLRIFTDTVASNYHKRLADRGIPSGQYGAVTVIQRANSDLRCNPHVHEIFLDGVYAPDRDGKGFMFHPAPAPTQADVEAIVERASKRILRFLQRRGVITLVTAPARTRAQRAGWAGAGVGSEVPEGGRR